MRVRVGEMPGRVHMQAFAPTNPRSFLVSALAVGLPVVLLDKTSSALDLKLREAMGSNRLARRRKYMRNLSVSSWPILCVRQIFFEIYALGSVEIHLEATRAATRLQQAA